MTRHEDSRQKSNLAQSRADCQAHSEIGSAQLSQTIRLRSTNDLIDVSKSRQRRDQMILNIAEVQKQIAVREDRVLIGRLAALHKSIQNVNLAMETADDVCYLLAKNVDLWYQGLGIIDAGDEYLVLNCFGFTLCIAGIWLEAVYDVVSVEDTFRLNMWSRRGIQIWNIHHCIAYPVTSQDRGIMHLANPFSRPTHMAAAARRKGDDAILEDENEQRS